MEEPSTVLSVSHPAVPGQAPAKILNLLTTFRTSFTKLESNPAKQYSLCMEYADQFVKLSEALDATIMEWFAIFEGTAMFKAYSASDKSVWQPIRTAVDRARETEKHKRSAWSAVAGKLGEGAVARLQHIGYGTTFAKQCAFLAARVGDWAQFCRWVNWVAFLRCTNGKQGQKRRPGVMPGDIASAHDRLNELSMLDMPTDDIVPAMLRPEQAEEIGCVVDRHGLLILRPVEARLIVAAAPVDPRPPPSPPASQSEPPSGPVAPSCPVSVEARNQSGAALRPSAMQHGTFSSLARLDEQGGARRSGARTTTLWVSFHQPWPPVLRGPPQITPGRICQLLGVDPDLEFPCRQKPTTIPQLLFGSSQQVSTASDRRPAVLAMAQQEVNMYLFHSSVGHVPYPGERELHTMYHSITQQLVRMDIAVWLWHLLSHQACGGQYQLLAYPTPALYNSSSSPSRATAHSASPQPDQTLTTPSTRQSPNSSPGGIPQNGNKNASNLRDHIGHFYLPLTVPRASEATEAGNLLLADPTGPAPQCATDGCTSPSWVLPASPESGPFVIVQYFYIPCDEQAGKKRARSAPCSTSQVRDALQQLTVPSHNIRGQRTHCPEYKGPWQVSQRLRSTCEIAAAIMGETSWDAPAVQWELNMLFEGDLGRAREHLANWRQQLLEQACRSWETVRVREMTLYGAGSFFLMQSRGQDPELRPVDGVSSPSPRVPTPDSPSG